VTAPRALRVFGALVRTGAVGAVAYRAEVVTWLLSTTMPLVMAAFFGALAVDAPVGRFDEREVSAYFLATFVVRTVTGCFASRQINLEIRDGTLATRLMRPVHPLVAYTAEILGAFPTRLAVIIPASVAFAALFGRDALARGPALLAMFAVALVGAWVLSLLVSFGIGALAFHVGQSDKVMDAYLTGLFVLSGYLVPIELFPPAVRPVLDWLPFRYQIGLPVELLLGLHGRGEALALVARQWAIIAVVAALVGLTWKRGVARFMAYGG
jgi:ABC-2 type transport system permease protein